MLISEKNSLKNSLHFHDMEMISRSCIAGTCGGCGTCSSCGKCASCSSCISGCWCNCNCGCIDQNNHISNDCNCLESSIEKIYKN